MRRTAVTLLLVGAFAAPVALPVLATTGAAAASSPSINPGTTSRSSDDARIAHQELGGRGVVVDQEAILEDCPGPPFVWGSESLEIRSTIDTEPTARPRRACARLLDEERNVVETVGCSRWDGSSRHRRTTVSLPKWPAGARGTHYVRVYLFEEFANGTAGPDGDSARVHTDTRTFEVSVIGKQGDLDGDGLANAREVAEGTDFTDRDTDGDALSDRVEVYQYGSDPLSADSTGDGIEDGTVVSTMLPPTVPYVVYAVTALACLGVVSAAYAVSRLRCVVGSGREPATQPGDLAVPVPDSEAEEGPRSTKEGEILAVLHEHGGRMRQADLIDETEWSKATVSRLLSALEEEGCVEKSRIGRDNVVQLTGPGPGLEDEPPRASS